MYVRPKDPEYQTASPTTIKEGNTPIRLVLEEQPKWHLLREVLDEIEQDLDTHTKGKQYALFLNMCICITA